MFSLLAARLPILIAPLIVIQSLCATAASSLSPTVIGRNKFGLGKAHWPNQRYRFDFTVFIIFLLFLLQLHHMWRCRLSFCASIALMRFFQVHVFFGSRLFSTARHYGVHLAPIRLILCFKKNQTLPVLEHRSIDF